MALLGCYAIKNNTFRDICSSEKDNVTINGTRCINLYNHNKLLKKYNGAMGIKTGFTKASGRCLVSAVEKDGTILVAVTLNAYDDWNDHIKLYDYCFNRISYQKVNFRLDCCIVPVVGSSKNSVKPSLSSAFFIPYYKEVPQYKLSYFVPRFIYSGIKKGDCIGWVEILDDKDVCIGEIYLVSPCKI
jgi:D-alanyl-D-alanine carboxypeptidase/D-alanyl-D-alanine carboxypeptidase (penicillin-binding protein 5/6)